MRRFLSSVTPLIIATMLCTAQIEGPWHGSADLGTQKLPLVFNINHDGNAYTATMDSPLQGAKGIPADIEVREDSIDISIPMIGAKYQGVLSDGEITGKLTQHGVELAITLKPGEYIPPRPQTPTPPYPYEVREVTVANPADGYELHGTLTLPLKYQFGGNKQYDAVVMVTGSGLQNRDEEIYGHKPFAVIAHHLALNGVASLRYDDRGYDDPSADLSKITTATNASDAKAAIKYLRDSVPRLNHIGILGHSEGGTIAFILAADGDADFAVSLAGTAVRGDSILIMQNERILGPQLGEPLTSAYLAGLRRTYDYMQQHPEAKEWPEIEATMADLMLPPQLVDNLKAIVSSRSPWIDYFLTFDPSAAITKINVPLFAANGTLDLQVDSDQNLGTLRRLLPSNDASVLKEYPGLNHLMQEAQTGQPSEYGIIEETISPTLLQDLVKWIRSIK